LGGSDEGSRAGTSGAGPLDPPAIREPDANGPSDAEAVARARSGDHEAFRVLVERYQGRAFRLAARVLRDDERARDVVQEAFLKVYGALRRFEGRSSFYTWLYRVVMNLCLDLRRRDKRGREVEWSDDSAALLSRAELDPGTPMASFGDDAPDALLERAELRERMAAAIEELPEAARATLVLREVEGLSYEEIAQTLGIPKGTVMSRLHYARRRVQAALAASGDAPGAAPEPDAEGGAT
jgi:RNA polymerase sigma-70 factor (ECF subfamily)